MRSVFKHQEVVISLIHSDRAYTALFTLIGLHCLDVIRTTAAAFAGAAIFGLAPYACGVRIVDLKVALIIGGLLGALIVWAVDTLSEWRCVSDSDTHPKGGDASGSGSAE